jgi:flavodoxin/ferredoxin
MTSNITGKRRIRLIIKICIYYFSGTGNTEVVSELFKKEFNKNKINVDLVKIEDVLKEKKGLEIEKYDLIGIAHPVYGLDLPGIIYKFINIMPAGNNKKIFLFKTAGDYLFLNNGASKYAIKKLKNKGFDVFHESLICMPSNWVAEYNEDVCKQLYNTAKVKAKNITNEILMNKKQNIKANIFLRFLVRFVNIMEDNVGARMFGRFLKVNKSCIDCGKCIRECPAENIYKKNNKIKFGWRCIFCMRCIYGCPENAIKAGHLKFVVLKNGYDIKKIINNNDTKGEYITKNTKGFYKRFYKYIYSE